MSSNLVWIDPPSGWQYGFPKLYDVDKDGDITTWLIREGLPAALADLGHYRMWEADSVG